MTARITLGVGDGAVEVEDGRRRSDAGIPKIVIDAAYLESKAMPEPNSGCLLWLGSVNANGYARIERTATRRAQQAHRVAWEIVNGRVPDGLVLDHLCRVRCCINPKHLEPVTDTENKLRGAGWTAQNARKAFCHAGHPLSGENLRINARGARLCKACLLEHNAKRRVRDPKTGPYVSVARGVMPRQWGGTFSARALGYGKR
jgi:hypothetical protein